MAALRGADLCYDHDPWRVSALITVLSELLLSTLLLLGAAIVYITSQLVKALSLEPPCTYLGWYQLDRSQLRRGGREAASASYTNRLSNRLSVDKFSPDLYNARSCKGFWPDDSLTSLCCDVEEASRATTKAGHSVTDLHANENDSKSRAVDHYQRKRACCIDDQSRPDNLGKQNNMMEGKSVMPVSCTRLEENEHPSLFPKSVSNNSSDVEDSGHTSTACTYSSSDPELEDTSHEITGTLDDAQESAEKRENGSCLPFINADLENVNRRVTGILDNVQEPTQKRDHDGRADLIRENEATKSMLDGKYDGCSLSSSDTGKEGYKHDSIHWHFAKAWGSPENIVNSFQWAAKGGSDLWHPAATDVSYQVQDGNEPFRKDGTLIPVSNKPTCRQNLILENEEALAAEKEGESYERVGIVILIRGSKEKGLCASNQELKFEGKPIRYAHKDGDVCTWSLPHGPLELQVSNMSILEEIVQNANIHKQQVADSQGPEILSPELQTIQQGDIYNFIGQGGIETGQGAVKDIFEPKEKCRSNMCDVEFGDFRSVSMENVLDVENGANKLLSTVPDELRDFCGTCGRKWDLKEVSHPETTGITSLSSHSVHHLDLEKQEVYIGEILLQTSCSPGLESQSLCDSGALLPIVNADFSDVQDSEDLSKTGHLVDSTADYEQLSKGGRNSFNGLERDACLDTGERRIDVKEALGLLDLEGTTESKCSITGNREEVVLALNKGTVCEGHSSGQPEEGLGGDQGDKEGEEGRVAKNNLSESQRAEELHGDKEGKEGMIAKSNLSESQQGEELHGDEGESLDALKEALETERSLSAALETELEKERNAAAIAASEAMAMISRLQEEKAAMQMEVAQLQRMSEEKADYDQQAMLLLEEILFKREKEKFVLEKEVELYREKLHAEKVDKIKLSRFAKQIDSSAMQSRKDTVPLEGKEGEGSALPLDKQNQGRHQKHILNGVLNPRSLEEEFRLESSRETELHDEQKASKRRRHAHLNIKEDGISPSMTIDGPIECKKRLPSPSWRSSPRKDDTCDLFVSGEWHIQSSHHQESEEVGKSTFWTDDEETHSILDRLWLIEEELQELRGKDNIATESDCVMPLEQLQQHNCKSESHDWPSYLVENSDNERVLQPDPWSVRSIPEDSGTQRDIEGIGSGTSHVHDVYEVQPVFDKHSRNSLDVEENGSLKEFGAGLKQLQLSPESGSVEFEASQKHKFLGRQKSSLCKTPNDTPRSHCPSILGQEKAWLMKHSANAEDCWEVDSHTGSIEEVQQLTVRLKVLEADRELFRQALVSLKQKDLEITLLEEIVQYLRDLQRGVRKENDSGDFSEDPIKKDVFAIKKGQYLGGYIETQNLLQQKEST